MATERYGNLIRWCGGRLVTSPAWHMMGFITFLIVAIGVVFFVFEAPFASREYSLAVPIVLGVVLLAALASLFVTAFTDPGVLPRRREGALPTQDELDRLPAVYYDMQVNGADLPVKFCHTCSMWRPPRCSHCSTCNCCIDRFDHHCEVVNNCIGRRNYRYFVVFLSSTSIGLLIVLFYPLFVVGFSITHMVVEAGRTEEGRAPFIHAFLTTPASFALILLCGVLTLSLSSLWLYHLRLLLTNATTNEQIKLFAPTRNGKYHNPYSRGPIMNVIYGCCGPRPVSYLHLRDEFAEGDEDEWV